MRVKHNIATFDLALSQEETLGMLAQKLMDLTGEYWKVLEVLVFIIYTSFTSGVPVSGQKMICSGKQLNTGDGWLERTIQEVRKTWTEKTYLGEKKLIVVRKKTYLGTHLKSDLRVGLLIQLITRSGWFEDGEQSDAAGKEIRPCAGGRIQATLILF